MNATSLRSRGSLLATLKEATLSHQVTTQPTPFSQELNTTTTGSQLASEKRVKNVSKTTMNGLFSFFKPLNQKQDKMNKKKTSLTKEEGSIGGQSHTASVSLESITVILLEEVHTHTHTHHLHSFIMCVCGCRLMYYLRVIKDSGVVYMILLQLLKDQSF